MLFPGLLSRMIQRNNVVGIRIDTGNVGPLVKIAAGTREAEIIIRVVGSMLLGDNVFDMKY